MKSDKRDAAGIVSGMRIKCDESDEEDGFDGKDGKAVHLSANRM